jgi:protein-histidine pros-kinase
MGLRGKFNLAFIFIFAVGVAVTAWVAYRLLESNAKSEVARRALLMMDAASAVRRYTIAEVRPQLNRLGSEEFLPQTVPAFAATETVGALGRTGTSYAGYTYREAVLNPTNPRDLASSWERQLVDTFRASPQQQELIGERGHGTERILYIARPIKITDAACLSCHSTPAAAPAALIRRYGAVGGFNWTLNEIVGAQVVTVPMSVPLDAAQRAFWTFITALGAILVAAAVVLNVMLARLILRPIISLSEVAEQISTGDFSKPEFKSGSQDEIARLGESFNRMKRSLQQAMQMLR